MHIKLIFVPCLFSLVSFSCTNSIADFDAPYGVYTQIENNNVKLCLNDDNTYTIEKTNGDITLFTYKAKYYIEETDNNNAFGRYGYVREMSDIPSKLECISYCLFLEHESLSQDFSDSLNPFFLYATSFDNSFNQNLYLHIYSNYDACIKYKCHGYNVMENADNIYKDIFFDPLWTNDNDYILKPRFNFASY